MSTTIFDAIKDDHQTLRTLLELIEKTHGRSDGRVELFRRFSDRLLAHSSAEERALYSVMLSDETLRERAGHSVKEHKDTEALLSELALDDMSSSAWVRKFRKLKEDLEHHLDEEEAEFFPAAANVLSRAQKESSAQEYRALYQDELAAE